MKNIILLFSVLIYSTAMAQTLKSRGKAFNPDIGVSVLFLDQSSSRDSEDDGMMLQEAELQFSSDVDAYFTARVLFAIEEEDGETAIEPEEAFVESISLPHITLKVGKSKMPLGKHNQLHAHAFPFINAPLQNEVILGEEGLNETGIGVSGLLPASWFSELTFNYVQGENEELFASDKKGNKTVVGRFKNLWDLSDSTTIELGLSGAQGKNSDDKITNLSGVDFTLKWRPTKGGKYNSLEWGTEFLQSNRRGADQEKLAGVASHIKYQLAQRWWTQYRYDYVGLNDPDNFSSVQRHTGLLAFIPSEFSGIRLQYETIDDGQDENEKRLSLQLNISIGAHPAHTY